MVKRIDHVAIVTIPEHFDTTIRYMENMGGEWYYTGFCDKYKTTCAFIRFKNIEIEIIESPQFDKFAKKHGGIALHHLAVEGDGDEIIEGAKPNMRIKFLPFIKPGILIEKVTYERNNIWDRIRRKLQKCFYNQILS